MRISLASLLLVLVGLPAFADDVYLTNGKSFKGVLADFTESQVRIRMPGGEIRLPKASVAKVETGDSTYAEYLRRKAALGLSAGAAEWLELARWSRANGFEQGAREAALKAAELDPGQKGLGPFLRAAGYAFDERLDRWIPYADEMRRQGFVLSGGQWVSREEQADRQRQREEQDARRAAQRAAEASRAASETQQTLAALQIYREAAAQGAAAPSAYGSDVYGYPLGFFPGFFFPAPSHSRHHHMGMTGHGAAVDPWSSFVNRQPGSLFPVGPSGTIKR